MSEQPHQTADHSSNAVPRATGTPHRDPHRPRTGPIVWGALILVFCAFMAQRTLAPGAIDATTWVIASVIGLGALLLIVGIAVILRARR